MANNSNDDATDALIKWNKCILCQKDTNDKLTNPAQNTNGYSLLARNLPEFYQLKQLPLTLSPYLIQNINNLLSIFMEHRVVWHKKCYIAFHDYKLQRARVRAEKKDIVEPSSSTQHMTRQVVETIYKKDTCLLCKGPASESNPLHQVMKQSCNDAILNCASVLNDYKLLAIVSETSDLIALEAKYHNSCLTELKNKRRTALNKKSDKVQTTTFKQLIAYINDLKNERMEIDHVINITDLAKQQEDAMRELGLDQKVNTSRLKESILKECPFLQSCEDSGKPSLLIFKDDVNRIVRSIGEREYTVEDTRFCEVANKIRSDMFLKNSEHVTAPLSLIELLKLIINGPTYSNTDDNDLIIKNISEIICFHATKKKYINKRIRRRYNRYQETSVPVYLALKLHVATRKKRLVDCAHRLGVGISYCRLQNLIAEKAKKVCAIYQKENVVCPPHLKKNIFTVAAVDNIDHNPSSATALTAFHGTAITLMQHEMPNELECDVSQGEEDVNDDLNSSTSCIQNDLPTSYSIVPTCFVDVKKSQCPISEVYTHNATSCIEEKDWLESTTGEEFKLWEAHHSQSDRPTDQRHFTNIALLPLFREESHSPAMMKHTMDIVEKAIHVIHPCQTPVLVADQPLYAILKQLQYLMPDKHGEEKIFIMMGGLHIEMVALRMVGQLLNGSGWTEALVQAKITTQGRSEALITASHVTRARHAHQITAAALYALQKKAYECDSNSSAMTFEEWRAQKKANVPQFKFWDLVLELEILVLQFVKANRKGDFALYLNAIRALLPWFFSLDHVNYARWLSVHLRDLSNLPHTHPSIAQKFEEGLFVARKTKRQFSGIALDQAHEQMNASLKGDGGMIGLTENPEALRKWLLAGPELAAMIHDFETDLFPDDCNTTATDEIVSHHSDTPAKNKKFMSDVRCLKEVIEGMENPFAEKSKDLYNIDSKKIASPEAAQTVMEIEEAGEKQYITFCLERLQSSEKSLHDAIKLNRLSLFLSNKRAAPKLKAKLSGLKNDCSLFSKLFIATSEHRAGDLDNFFAHENQNYPPSISNLGSLKFTTKSDLVNCVIDLSSSIVQPQAPQVTAKILDGGAIVHFLKPGQCKTFEEYAKSVFIPFLHRELSNSSRVDVVWDRYDEDSLKNNTRQKRGTGDRTRVQANTRIPKNWENFLKDGTNKEELFQLLGSYYHSSEINANQELNITNGTLVHSTRQRSKETLQPCNHEEADTRMFVHLADAVKEGHQKVMLRSVDTDVLVLAISCVPNFPETDLWVHLGTGKNHQFLHCNEIAKALGPSRTKVLPIFHAFTGCDTVSGFNGKGKKTAFEAWKMYEEATQGFEMLLNGDLTQAFPIIQKYVVTMYDKSTRIKTVNECRKELFTKKNRQMENIPPTEDSLYQHMLRAVYQGVHVWGQLLEPRQNLPSPQEWGWTLKNSSWIPTWTTKPIAARACLELMKCRCKRLCSNRCNCKKRKLKCTELCLCSGTC